MGKEKGMGNAFFKMELNIKVILKTISLKGKGRQSFQMANFIWVNGKMGRDMVLENCNILMVIFMKVSLKTMQKY